MENNITSFEWMIINLGDAERAKWCVEAARRVTSSPLSDAKCKHIAKDMIEFNLNIDELQDRLHKLSEILSNASSKAIHIKLLEHFISIGDDSATEAIAQLISNQLTSEEKASLCNTHHKWQHTSVQNVLKRHGILSSTTANEERSTTIPQAIRNEDVNATIYLLGIDNKILNDEKKAPERRRSFLDTVFRERASEAYINSLLDRKDELPIEIFNDSFRNMLLKRGISKNNGFLRGYSEELTGRLCAEVFVKHETKDREHFSDLEELISDLIAFQGIDALLRLFDEDTAKTLENLKRNIFTHRKSSGESIIKNILIKFHVKMSEFPIPHNNLPHSLYRCLRNLLAYSNKLEWSSISDLVKQTRADRESSTLLRYLIQHAHGEPSLDQLTDISNNTYEKEEEVEPIMLVHDNDLAIQNIIGEIAYNKFGRRLATLKPEDINETTVSKFLAAQQVLSALPKTYIKQDKPHDYINDDITEGSLKLIGNTLLTACVFDSGYNQKHQSARSILNASNSDLVKTNESLKNSQLIQLQHAINRRLRAGNRMLTEDIRAACDYFPDIIRISNAQEKTLLHHFAESPASMYAAPVICNRVLPHMNSYNNSGNTTNNISLKQIGLPVKASDGQLQPEPQSSVIGTAYKYDNPEFGDMMRTYRDLSLPMHMPAPNPNASSTKNNDTVYELPRDNKVYELPHDTKMYILSYLFAMPLQ